jgi:glycosyltransferase involved in cell wall biosynthesis
LWRSAYGRRRGLGDALLDWLEAKQVGDADGAFAPSRFIARAFGRFEGVPVRVIRTPVDAAPSLPDPAFQAGNLGGKRYLLFFGTLSFIKGIGVIAEALPGILARHPDLHAAFIGRDDGIPGGKRAFAHVREACRGSESRLFYHPAVPKASLLPVIAAAEGVLMPSLADNYPNACLEAMAQGSIVVGSRDSSLDEMIRDGVDGFLCENGNAASLAEAIERLLGLEPRAKERMRMAARAAMEAAVAEDRIGELLGYYREVMAARAAGRREGP